VSTKDSAVQCTLISAPLLSRSEITEEQDTFSSESDTPTDADEDFTEKDDMSDLERYSRNLV